MGEVQPQGEQGAVTQTFRAECHCVGAVLWCGEIEVRSWLGTMYHDAAKQLAEELNAAVRPSPIREGGERELALEEAAEVAYNAVDNWPCAMDKDLREWVAKHVTNAILKLKLRAAGQPDISLIANDTVHRCADKLNEMRDYGVLGGIANKLGLPVSDSVAVAIIEHAQQLIRTLAGQPEQPREAQIRLDEAKWWADGEHGAHNLQALGMQNPDATCSKCERIVKLEAALTAAPPEGEK
jgi:hypothetical protein